MSISKTALSRRVAAVAVGLGALLFGGPAGAFAASPAQTIPLRGRVLPLSGASAPPSSVVVEVRPALENFAAQRAALHGVEPAAVATARTAADGSFVLSVRAPGCYRISVRARGFRTLEIPLLPLVEPTDLPPVVPVAVRPLSVSVLNPAGQPVGVAVIRATAIDPMAAPPADPGAWRPALESVRTDSQGRGIVSRSPGERVRLLVETAAGAGLAEVEADAPWVVVQLAPRPTLSLAVRDVAGRPASGALVYSAGRAVAELDEEGRTEVLALAAGSPPLLILAQGGAWAEVTAPTAPATGAGDGKAPTAIRLQPPRKARGRVLESITGKPLPGALVWALWDQAWLDVLDGAGPADAEGRFEVLVAGSGKPTLGAAAAGHVWRQILAPVPGPRDQPIDLRLDRATDPRDAVGITGIVLDEEGEAVGGAELFAVRETASGIGADRTTERKERRLGTSDTHGGFHAGGLEPGTFDLIVRANGYVAGKLPALALAAGGRLPDLKIVLSRGLRIEGQVRDARGNPAAGVTVEARKVAAKVQGGETARLSPPQSSIVTDRGGLFDLSGLEPGRYEVTAESPLGRTSTSIEVSAPGGGRIQLQLAPVR